MLAVAAVGVVLGMVAVMMAVMFGGGSQNDTEMARRPTSPQKNAAGKGNRDAEVVPPPIEESLPVKESFPVQESLSINEGFSVEARPSVLASSPVEVSSRVEETPPAKEGFFVEESPPVAESPPAAESRPVAESPPMPESPPKTPQGTRPPSTQARPPSKSKGSVRAHVHLKIISYPPSNADLVARQALGPVIWAEPNAIRVDRSANEIVIGIRVMAVNTHDAKRRLERVGFVIGGASFKPVRN